MRFNDSKPAILYKSLAFFLACFLLVTGANAQSEKVCKGSEQEQCSVAEHCSWVKSYVRKDGRKVQGFCRTKAKKKQQTETTERKDS